MAVRPAVVEPPATLIEIADGVERRLAAVLDAEVARWREVDVALAEPLGTLRSFVLSGGKRLRPAFCHWGFVGAGGSPDDPAIVDAGAALELLHTFALLHDDVMDGSTIRRGARTVHLSWVDRHAAEGWRGEGRRFGEGVAVLVGDLAFVYADLLLQGAPAAARQVFTDLRLEVNIGQFLDVMGTVRGTPTVAAARRICQYKTGKYTIERPLHLGAALAGRLEDAAPSLTAFGLPLGEAFQLRDDLLGAFGDTQVLGKAVGDDIREGKPTALVALALEAATGADERLLLARYGAEDLCDDEVKELQAVLERSGARAAVDQRIDELVAEALTALDSAPLTAEARERLAELARYVAGRDR